MQALRKKILKKQMKNETAILFQMDSPEFRLIYAMPTFVLDVQAPLMAI